MNASKAVQLLSLLPKRPVEFCDRLMTVIEMTREPRRAGFPNGNTLIFTEALELALGISKSDVTKLLAENELQRLEKKITTGITNAKSAGPFDAGHNGNFCLARSTYVMCHLLSPHVVVETGVASGATTAFTLPALAANRKGPRRRPSP